MVIFLVRTPAMTISQAWTVIANAYDRYATTGRPTALTSAGLCAATRLLRERGQITEQQEDEMDRLIEAALDERTLEDIQETPGYLAVLGWRTGSALRATLAGLYAAMTA